jgi:hypothetical protein
MIATIGTTMDKVFDCELPLEASVASLLTANSDLSSHEDASGNIARVTHSTDFDAMTIIDDLAAGPLL